MKWRDRKRYWIVDVLTRPVSPETEPWVAREVPDMSEAVLGRTMATPTVDGVPVLFATVQADNELAAKHAARRLLRREHPEIDLPRVEKW